jgi:hypothetical protein
MESTSPIKHHRLSPPPEEAMYNPDYKEEVPLKEEVYRETIMFQEPKKYKHKYGFGYYLLWFFAWPVFIFTHNR